MISTGAMVNAPIACSDPDGDMFVTLLHVISSRADLPKSTEVLAEIVRGKANLNARSSLGATPLARACLYKHIGAAELLLQFGADPSPTDDKGRDALHCAVSLEIDTNSTNASSIEDVSGSLVALLASKSADLDTGSEVPPLLEAVRQTNRPAVLSLIAHGAKPRFLHVAVDQAPSTIIEDLLKGLANPFEQDAEGKSVLDVAFRRGDEEITTLLRDFIGDLERRQMTGPMIQVGRQQSQQSSISMKDDLHGDDDMTLGLSTNFTKDRNIMSKTTSARSREAGHGGGNQTRRFSLSSSAMMKRRPQKGVTKDKMMDGIDLDKKYGKFRAPIMRFLHSEKFTKFQFECRRINRHRRFQLAMFAALLVVLFFPDLWIVADMEDNGSLDGILIIVLVLFVAELALQSIGTPKTYINSFFFWMDIVGLLSVPLDHSMVANSMPRNFDNTVVMRAARTARLGARAGRFTKLVKLLRFLPGVHQEESGPGKSGTAKTMSNALMTSLSTRVSCLIIVMVMVLPLFEMATYPENDYSMKTWMNSLEFTLGRYGAETMENRLADFESFYGNKDYFPFEVYYTNRNGSSLSKRLKGRRPRRFQNELEIKAASGSLRAMFNFGSQNRIDALCNMVLIVVIIILMMGFSLLMSNSVSAIVLRPLENLLRGVKHMASRIFKSVTSMAAKCATADEQGLNAEENDTDFVNETELLEKVIDKLAALSAITMKTSPIDAETLEQMGETDRAVLQGFSPDQLPTIQHVPAIRHSSDGSASSQISDLKEDETEELVLTLEKTLEEAGLAWGLVDSWEFNALEIEEQQRQLACLCFIIFHLGLGYNSKQQGCLATFIEVAAMGYSNPTKVPYHNWYHAADVTHCVFRLLTLCATERFLSNIERFALVASAVCHDIGHPGQNNPFLVETSHELAIRYNDRSPLENMHCARLFEIISQPKAAIFGSLDKQQYREVRQVCIEAILHTDNVHHFAMVKEMQMLYEMNSDVFDIALQMHQTGQVDFPPREVCDIFAEPEKKKSMRNLLLHFSDISNPMKPFNICKDWAWRIVDEFFLQGDREKELGITVQPLNDRDKVNRPYSQVGFIEFFVAPFAFATVRLLPPLVSCTDQLMHNLRTWCEEWVSSTTPAPDPEDVLKLQDRIAKLEAKFIFREGF